MGVDWPAFFMRRVEHNCTMAATGTRSWRVGGHGAASIVATAYSGRTALTRITHRSPVRLLPMRTAAAEQAGAALCAIGSHGGGLLGGDVVEVDAVVGANATLALSTQSSTKVYRTLGPTTEQRLRATVALGGLFVNAPDSLVPFANSDLEQTISVALEPGGSAVLVDWIGAGRVANGERWAFRRLWSRTELHLVGAPGDVLGTAAAAAPHVLSQKPQDSGSHDPSGGVEARVWAYADRPADLVEALCLDRPAERAADGSSGARHFGMQLGSATSNEGATFGACATVVLAGPRAAQCVEAFQFAALRCAARRARTRTPSSAQQRHTGAAGAAAGLGAPPLPQDSTADTAAEEAAAAMSDAVDAALKALHGSVHVGVSLADLRHDAAEPSKGLPAAVAVARLVGQRGEDVSRVLAACLSPLAQQLGTVPYADRLHSRATAAVQPRDTAFSPLALFGRAAASTQASLSPGVHSAAEHGMPRPGTFAVHPQLPSGGAAAPELDVAAQWRLCMLVDSCLPTGGFAHSGGLEAAKQLVLGARAGGVGAGKGGAVSAAAIDTVAAMLAAGARSSARLHSAFVASAHAAVSAARAAAPAGARTEGHGSCEEADKADEALHAEWDELDSRLCALLCGLEPAAKASRLQGAALARVAGQWLGATQDLGVHRANASTLARSPGARLLARVHRQTGGASQLRKSPAGVHASIAFGVLAATLDIPLSAAVRAHSFVSARDALSAAIRLDLVGPLQAVALMAMLQGAAHEGERAAEHATRQALVKAGFAPLQAEGDWPLEDALVASQAARLEAVRHAGGCAPLLDTVHACHDLLEMRLFQT